MPLACSVRQLAIQLCGAPTCARPALSGCAQSSAPLRLPQVSQSFLNVVDAVGIGGAFAMFGGIGVVSMALLWRYLPETMGVPLERLSMLFEDPYPFNIQTKSGTEASGLLTGRV